MRNIRGTVALPVLLCTALLLSACSSGSDDGDSSEPRESANGSATAPTSPSPSATPDASASPAPGTGTGTGMPAAEAPVSLTVDYSADGTAPSSSWTLQCDGAVPREGSTVPDPAAACAAIAEQGTALFAEADPKAMCTQNIAGMQRAHVTGTVNGEAVDTTFSLTDGCQISRWERLPGLLGPAEGVV